MFKTLQYVNKHLVQAIPAAMAAGFAWGLAWDAAALKALIIPFTFLMVYPMMITLRVGEVAGGGDGKAQFLAQAVNFGIIPFAAFAAGRIFFPHQPYMALGLLLAGLVPTSGMTISWTGLAKGNVAAAVRMTVVGLTLGSLLTPVYVRGLLGASIQVDFAAVFRQIALIVFLPMAAGRLTRYLLTARIGARRFKAETAPRLPSLSTLGVLGIVFVAMALKARDVAAEPAGLLAILPPLLLLYTFNYVLSIVLGRALLPRGDAIAMVYGTVMRNLSIALALAINAFGPQGAGAALVIAAAYIIQVQSAAWFVRFTDRIHGPAVVEPEPETEPEPESEGAAA